MSSGGGGQLGVVAALDGQDLGVDRAASTAPVATRRMARWWNPASTTRAQEPGPNPSLTRL